MKRNEALKLLTDYFEELLTSRHVQEALDTLNTPIPMQIFCPLCKTQHIDVGEFATKPHHTHSCQNKHCGLTWRPAIEHTVGVQCLPGFLNPETEPAQSVDEHAGLTEQVSNSLECLSPLERYAKLIREGMSQEQEWREALESHHAAVTKYKLYEGGGGQGELERLREGVALSERRLRVAGAALSIK